MRPVWILITIIAAIDAIWIPMANMEISPQPLLILIAALSFLLLVNHIYKNHRPDPRLALLAETGAVMIAYTAAAGVLSYLMVTLRLPLLDEHLVAADRALGLDWPTLYAQAKNHPLSYFFLAIAYNSLIPQIILLLLVFSYRNQPNRSYELIWLFVITSLSCVLLSGPLPTAGAFAYFNTSINDPYVQSFLSLRDGSMKTINLQQVEGVVQFPSLHLALAVCCAYVARGTKFLFPALVALNIIVIIATPFIGGHHFADLWGGALLTAAAIFIIRKTQKRIPQ